MTDQTKSPETLADAELDAAQGGAQRVMGKGPLPSTTTRDREGQLEVERAADQITICDCTHL